jgi:hypothetical protein
MYKMTKNFEGVINGVQRLSDITFIPLNNLNTDYSRFKKEIENDEAELQDADGNTMTADEAKAFIATLP